MKLSEAIILGDTLKRADPSVWLSQDGSCGCAFGGALLAAGADVDAFYNGHRSPHESESVLRLWLWLTCEHTNEISLLYQQVCDGACKLEHISEYVKSVEPANDGGRASAERGARRGEFRRTCFRLDSLQCV